MVSSPESIYANQSERTQVEGEWHSPNTSTLDSATLSANHLPLLVASGSINISKGRDHGSGQAKVAISKRTERCQLWMQTSMQAESGKRGSGCRKQSKRKSFVFCLKKVCIEVTRAIGSRCCHLTTIFIRPRIRPLGNFRPVQFTSRHSLIKQILCISHATISIKNTL